MTLEGAAASRPTITGRADVTKTTKSDCGIEVVKHKHRQMIVMPRYGLKNTIVREKTVSMPRVRFLEGDDKSGEPRK